MPAEHPSVCTFDCPDTCSLTVTVDNDQIVKVRGSEVLPFTDGVICNKLGATKLSRGSLCGLVRNEAWAGTYGAAPGIGPEACAGAQLNVVWGNNATVTNVHLVRQVRIAKRKGGRLAVVDPLRTKIA